MTRLIKIRESFHHPLPYTDGRLASATANASSAGTATDPPVFGIFSEHRRYQDKGLGVVKDVKLPEEYLALPEKAMHLENEGDVRSAAALYLLHPINQVLSAHRSDRDIRCLAEDSKAGARPDTTYSLVQNRTSTYYAVVEFKKRGVISKSEFKSGCQAITPGISANDLRQKAPLVGQDVTYFSGNAHKLMKQASAYAVRRATQYVALCDWNYLVLIRFTELKPGQNYVGDYCDIVIINQPRDVRAALLGFLLEAYEKKFVPTRGAQ